MARVKLVLLSLLAVFALGAVASASASAQEWLIEGKGLKAGESAPVSGSAAGSLTLLLTLSNIHVVLLCDKASGTGTIVGPSSATANPISFSECKVVEPKCTTSATLKTKEISISLLVLGESRLISFIPKAGESTEFVTVELGGCAVEGEYKITGSVGCELLHPFESAVLQDCSFELGKDQKLLFGKAEADLEGEISFVLTGADEGKKWSVT